MRTENELKFLQALPLDIKIRKTQLRIEEAMNRFGGNIYMSYSGGKDSDVLLDILFRMYPNIISIFGNTHTEYPETYIQRKKQIGKGKRIIQADAPMTFNQVVNKYGYPMFTKKVAGNIRCYRNARSQKVIDTVLGYMGRQMKKYLKYKDMPFSDMCCSKLKHGVVDKLAKKKGFECAFVATTTEESQYRKDSWLESGCNAFDRKAGAQSRPLSFWTEKDIWEYINTYDVDVCDLYHMGYERNGCMYCGFGCQFETPINRIQRLSLTHPKAYGVWERNYKKYFDMADIDCTPVYKNINIVSRDFVQTKLIL